jgi:hypothetical protein
VIILQWSHKLSIDVLLVTIGTLYISKNYKKKYMKFFIILYILFKMLFKSAKRWLNYRHLTKRRFVHNI